MLSSNPVGREFEPRPGLIKDYKIGMLCWFSAKHVPIKRKSQDWLARNQDKESEMSDMSIRRQLFQWTNTDYDNPTKCVWSSANQKSPSSYRM